MVTNCNLSNSLNSKPRHVDKYTQRKLVFSAKKYVYLLEVQFWTKIRGNCVKVVFKSKDRNLWQFTTRANSDMNQPEFLAITYYVLKAMEIFREQVSFVLFRFHSLKNWSETFKPITKSSNEFLCTCQCGVETKTK